MVNLFNVYHLITKSSWHLLIVCIHIESATEKVVYEVIAELQEQTEQAPQEFRDDPAQGPVDTSTEQQPEGKPRCTSYYLKL